MRVMDEVMRVLFLKSNEDYSIDKVPIFFDPHSNGRGESFLQTYGTYTVIESGP